MEEVGSRLADLIDAATRGEEVVITRGEQPAARLVPVQPPAPGEKARLRFGSAKGTFLYVADDFDAPLEDFREYME